MKNEVIIQWLEQIFRRRVLALRVCLVVFGVIAVGSVLLAPTYESVSDILVQSNRSQLLVSPGLKEDAGNQSTQAVPVIEQDLNSEVELLTSPYLIQQGLAGVKVSQHSGGLMSGLRNAVIWTVSLPSTIYMAMHGGPNPTANQETVRKISNHLSATVIKRSNIIEVAFRAHDAAWAQAFLSNLMSSYLAMHARLS